MIKLDIKYTSILFFFVSNVSIFAQLDNGKTNTSNGKTIGVLNIPATVKEVKKPKSIEFENDNGFKTANKELEKKRKQKQKEREIENKGIITPEMMANRAYNKNIEGGRLKFPMIDMDLGSFHTQSDAVYISSYDFGRFDGDKVSIACNGGRVHNNYLLTPKPKMIKIPLKIGINKVEVTALNEGELSPNTGYFLFSDNKGVIIKEGQWMLAEGAKVIVIVVRDEK